MEKRAWKVIVLRNGAPEAVRIEAHFMHVDCESGVLRFDESLPEHRCEAVHVFAPGVWLEVTPTEWQADKALRSAAETIDSGLHDEEG